MESISGFEIHFYLGKDRHSADAYAINKCDAAFLAVIGDFTRQLGINIEVDAEALAEGGLRRRYKISLSDKIQFAGIAIGLVALILGSIQLYFTIYPPKDKELDQLQKENYRLQNAKLKREMDEVLRKESSDGIAERKCIDHAVDVMSKTHSMNIQRSKFYTAASSIPYLEKIGYSQRADANSSEEVVVERGRFSEYIFSVPQESVEQNGEAIIELIAPIIKRGRNYRWKGIYNQKTIDFNLSDDLFKRDVFSSKVKFANGSTLTCVLNITHALNDDGEDIVKGYDVPLVLSWQVDGVSRETDMGKIYAKSRIKAVIGAQDASTIIEKEQGSLRFDK